MSDAPLPRFTIEELLREAVEAVPTDERCVFTSRDLANLWGYRSLESARRQMPYLEEVGWKFITTQKVIISRAGILTPINAYIVIPPITSGGKDITDAARDTDTDNIIPKGAS